MPLDIPSPEGERSLFDSSISLSDPRFHFFRLMMELSSTNVAFMRGFGVSRGRSMAAFGRHHDDGPYEREKRDAIDRWLQRMAELDAMSQRLGDYIRQETDGIDNDIADINRKIAKLAGKKNSADTIKKLKEERAALRRQKKELAELDKDRRHATGEEELSGIFARLRQYAQNRKRPAPSIDDIPPVQPDPKTQKNAVPKSRKNWLNKLLNILDEIMKKNKDSDDDSKPKNNTGPSPDPA